MIHDVPEGKWTRKARFRVGKLTQVEHEINQREAELDNLKRTFARGCEALKVELVEMERADEPEPRWAAHWRINYTDLPRRPSDFTRKEEARS